MENGLFRKANYKLVIPVLLLILTLIIGCGEGNQNDISKTVDVVFTSGTTAGTWLPAAAAMSEILQREVEGLRVTVIEGGGGVNTIRVAKGKDADIGLSYTSEFYSALNNEGAYEGEDTDDLTAMFYTSITIYSIFVRADSDIYSVEDLVGKRVAASNPGDGAELITRYVLDAYGLTYDDIESGGGKVIHTGTSEMAGLMKDGHVDAVTVMGPIPQSIGMELEVWKPIRSLSIDREKIKQLCSKWSGYIEEEIPAGSYKGHDETAYTIGAPVMMIANKNVPEDLVYEITKVLMEFGTEIAEQQSEYVIGHDTAVRAVADSSLYHPGAYRYLKEKGLLE